MPDDHRIVFEVLGTILPVFVTVFLPLSQTSIAPPEPASLSRVTTRIHVPRRLVILPTVPLMPPEPPNRISSPRMNISSHGPSGFSGENCWNVTFWWWNFQLGAMYTAWP